LVQVEVAFQFAIDSRQHVQVECSRHAQRIIVSIQQLVHRLEQVSSQQQRVPRVKRLADLMQKLHSRGAIEIANRAAQEQHEQVLSVSTSGSDLRQPFQVLALKAHNADGIDVA